jgi:hypothetical protein
MVYNKIRNTKNLVPREEKQMKHYLVEGLNFSKIRKSAIVVAGNKSDAKSEAYKLGVFNKISSVMEIK